MKVIKNVAAFLVALITWFVSMEIIWLVVYYVGSIPFIGPILYLGDVSWAQSVLSSTTSVFLGAMVSIKICKNAKLFCWFIIAINVLFLLYLLINLSFSWDLIIFFVSGAMTALVVLFEKEK